MDEGMSQLPATDQKTMSNKRTPMPQFSLSPSRIARGFYHECDRYLRYHATPRKQREAAGVPVIVKNQSPITAALLKGGYVWEERIGSER